MTNLNKFAVIPVSLILFVYSSKTKAVKLTLDTKIQNAA